MIDDRRDRINLDSATPLWRQLYDDLAKDIESGRLKPGARLPGEYDLMERYGISRVTARRAVGELVKNGLAVTVHGKGSYVSETVQSGQGKDE